MGGRREGEGGGGGGGEREREKMEGREQFNYAPACPSSLKKGPRGINSNCTAVGSHFFFLSSPPLPPPSPPLPPLCLFLSYPNENIFFFVTRFNLILCSISDKSLPENYLFVECAGP